MNGGVFSWWSGICQVISVNERYLGLLNSVKCDSHLIAYWSERVSNTTKFEASNEVSMENQAFESLLVTT